MAQKLEGLGHDVDVINMQYLVKVMRKRIMPRYHRVGPKPTGMQEGGLRG